MLNQTDLIIMKERKNMKRISMKIKALAAIMTLILTLTAIPALADGTTDRLDEIKERGYLIVGTEGTWR